MNSIASLLMLALATAAPSAIPPFRLTTRSLAIKNFTATITVNRDASVDVTETITAEFTGAWNGIYRTIPVEYHTPQGFNWTLRLDLQSATDQSGNRLKVESGRERHYIKYKIWVPGAEDVTRTIVLHYRAQNGLRFFPDHDELYWNVTGDEWDVPIEAASAQIELPPSATGVRAIAFNGAYGSTERDAKLTVEGRTIRVTMPHALGFHEGMTAVVGWDKGAVVEPTAADKAIGFLASNWPLGIPILVFLGMFALWARVGRDPRRLPIVVQYEPKDGLTPAEAGTLIDSAADMRDITATVVDLAVRGYLKIEEREESKLFGLMKGTEYVFHQLEPPAGASRLEPHEQGILNGIFGIVGAEVKLSDLANQFYRNLPGIRDNIFLRLIDRGLYRTRPDKVQGRWLGVAVVIAGGLVLLGSKASAKLSLTPLPFLVAAGLSGLVVALFARIMPARTVAGARALERVLGFEEFIRRVEEPQFARIRTPEMFERFLPFAMAFKLEQRWAKAFQDLYREPPRWYSGGSSTAFSLDHFSSRLGDLSTRVASTMSSSPRSSGGSGFSGGSSGGGSGGGGGGGF